MATAFSTANMKAEFPNIRAACSQLIEVLKTVGPQEVVDIDNALCRESLDVIGAPRHPSHTVISTLYSVHLRAKYCRVCQHSLKDAESPSMPLVCLRLIDTGKHGCDVPLSLDDFRKNVTGSSVL